MLRVTDLSYTNQVVKSEVSISVTISQGSLFAVISGGADIPLPVGSSVVLNGNGSYDEDLPTTSVSSLLFQWDCFQLLPSYIGTCPFELVVSSSTVTVAAASTLLNFPTARITLTVTDATGQRSSSAHCSVFAIAASAPRISVSADRPSPVVKDVSLLLTGAISTSVNCISSWSVNDTGLELATAA